MVKHLTRIAALQQRRRRLMAVRHNHPAFFKGAPTFFQRISDISQGLFGVVAQMIGQSQRCRIKGRFGLCRNHQWLKRPQAFIRNRPKRGLFQHRMRIGTANAKAVYAPPARAI